MINHTGTPLRIVEFMTVLAAATPAYATLSQEKSSNASRRFVDTCLQKYKKTWKEMLFWEKNLRKRVESLVETDNSPLSLDEMNVFMLCGENTFSDIFLKNKEKIVF